MCKDICSAEDDKIHDIFRPYTADQAPHCAVTPPGIVSDHVVSDEVYHVTDYILAEFETMHNFFGQTGTCLFMAVKDPFLADFLSYTWFGNIVKEGCKP